MGQAPAVKPLSKAAVRGRLSAIFSLFKFPFNLFAFFVSKTAEKGSSIVNTKGNSRD